MFKLDHYQVAEPVADNHHPLRLPPDVISALQLRSSHEGAILIALTKG